MPDSSAVSKYEVTSGFYLKLADYQVNLKDEAVYTHEVRNVISFSGITNASQLLVSYDPDYQHLQVHHLYIWRNGEKIDRTKELSLEVLNNEYALNQGIYTGAISIYDNLEDVRKDDMIDFAYTIVGQNPIFEDHKYLFVPLAAMNPIDLLSLRVIFPESSNYHYECVDCDSFVVVDEVLNSQRQIEIQYANLKALDLEDNMPSWLTPYPHFILSSDDSWQAVNDWAQEVFALKQIPNLNDVYEEVLNGNESMEQKITRLIDYVQDDIRYMGIESGIGSIKPFPPEQVVKQRFGDCKDKSLLLVWLLKNIGIEKAYPALVNTGSLHQIDKYKVSNQVFDHCIVMFEYESEIYWVDPTSTMQGGSFKDINTYDYGKALVVGLSSDTLRTMKEANQQGRTNYTDAFKFQAFDQPGQLFITSERHGFEADNRRQVMEHYSVNDIEKGLGSDLQTQFPHVEKTGDVQINDDERNNTFTMNYSYEVGGMWQDGDELNPPTSGYWIFKFEPRTVFTYINEMVCETRQFEYALNHPQIMQYKVLFEFPKELLIDDYFNVYNNSAYEFKKTIEQLNSKSFEITYDFESKATSLEPRHYKDVCEQNNELIKKLPVVIYFPK